MVVDIVNIVGASVLVAVIPDVTVIVALVANVLVGRSVPNVVGNTARDIISFRLLT